MAIKLGAQTGLKDLYVDYPFEDVMFRRLKNGEAIYRKFYGEEESSEVVSHDNRLYNDALLMGDEISKEEYEAGKNIE